MLLDLAGLDKHERIMIQASIGNSRDFDKIAEALAIQHPRIHLNEIKRNPTGKGKGNRSGQGKFNNFRKGKGKSKFPGRFVRQAYIAEEEDQEEDYDYDAYIAADEEPYTDPAYWDPDEAEEHAEEESGNAACQATDEWNVEAEYVDTLEEKIELDCVAYLHELHGDEIFEQKDMCRQYIQDSKNTAYAAFKGKGGKGKARGKGKGSQKGSRYPVRPSGLSIEDRRQGLEKLKSETSCNDWSSWTLGWRRCMSHAQNRSLGYR